MLRKMEAEVLFLNPTDRSPGVAALAAAGFEVELLNWIDEYSEAVWIKARLDTDISENKFRDLVASVVDNFDGDIVEFGLANPPLDA
ncbi:MAG TPA: hypothetical protein VFP82_06030 [Chthoniobacterales bacterium]|nr:hypothetical protein [Chthoniobacterales bacterium]